MAKIPERTKETEKIIHIMVTNFCNRDCKYCCNKQYNLNDVPYVTNEELSKAHTVCLTGGEPFSFSNPSAIAKKIKKEHSNVKNVYVYSSAIELMEYLNDGYGKLDFIDGITVSIKNKRDKEVFEKELLNNNTFLSLSSNQLYVFPGYEETFCIETIRKIVRPWQADYQASEGSMFRKM